VKVEVLIVGAGPTGLSAARRLDQTGRDDWLLLEREGAPGGLAASFADEAGFTWDLGGHVVHSHYPEFSDFVAEVMGPDLLEHERRAFIRAAARWVPYPFQNNLHHLPARLRDDCLQGMIDARAAAGAAPPPADFSSWVNATFGRGIAELFMRPYNRKLWCCELRELSADWVADRVSLPDLDRLAADVRAGRDDSSFGANATFTFPKSGGTGELWRRAAERLPGDRLRFGAALESLDLERRVCRLAGGEEIAYGSLVVTIPLDELVGAAGRDDLVDPARRLEHNSVEILGLGLAGSPPEPVREMCWTYFPDPKVPFYRATVFSNYSPDNVPRPGETWSLMLEVARRPGWRLPAEELWGRVMQSAAAEGLISREAGVVSRWKRSLPYAYPLPSLGRAAALSAIVPDLEERSVYPRGRFGAWRYEIGNMDHCFMQGLEVVDRILEGRPETVLPPPEKTA
jgi:UDP-galactopyranose mutase